MTCCTFGDINVFFHSSTFDGNRGSHWMHFCLLCLTVFRLFFCLNINCQPFNLRQLLKLHPFDWLIEIHIQTEDQGTHHKMVLLQPIPNFPPLLPDTGTSIVTSQHSRSDLVCRAKDRIKNSLSLSSTAEHISNSSYHRRSTIIRILQLWTSGLV